MNKMHAHQHVFKPRRIVVSGDPQPKPKKLTLMQKLRALRMEGDSNAKR